MTIQLGNLVRDIITGFQGTAISRVEYLTGCTQFGVVPKCGKDGKYPDAQYFDDKRLEFVKEGAATKVAKTGGLQIDAPRR